MDTFGENLDAEFSADQAAQRCRRPELVVIAASRIQRDAQAWLPDTLTEMLNIMRQVETAALFASLDDDDASRMRNRMRLQRTDRAETREHRVPIVGAAAAIKTIALEHRIPRAETSTPTGHLRLLVHVPIEQHAIFGVTGNIREQQRRAARESHNFHRHPLQRLAARPILEARDRAIHVPMRLPVAIESDRLVRDPDVLDQFGNHGLFPEPIDVTAYRCLIHGAKPTREACALAKSSALEFCGDNSVSIRADGSNRNGNRVSDFNRTLASRLPPLSRVRLPRHPRDPDSVGRGQLADLFDRAQPDGARLRRTFAIRSDDGLHVAG